MEEYQLEPRKLAVPWDSDWREIPLFPGYYLNQYGQVFSMKRNALLATYLNQHGVRCVRMYSRQVSAQGRGYSRSTVKLLAQVHPLAPPVGS